MDNNNSSPATLSTQVVKPKRQVGRPRKNDINKDQRKGLQLSPTTPTNIYEIVIDTSEFYRDLANICKIYNVEEVRITHLQSVTYINIDKKELFEKFEISISSEKCVWYYVKQPITYTITILEPKNITWFAMNLRETFFIVEFIDSNCKQKNNVFAREFIKSFITPMEFIGYEPIDDTKYQLSFDLPSAWIKGKSTAIKQVTDTFEFQRTAPMTLSISYVGSSNKTNMNIVFDKELIKLKDNLDENKIQMMPINISLIETFLSICLSEYINIKFIKDTEIIYTYNLYEGIAFVRMQMRINNAGTMRLS
jgi:hypothetical protein